MSKPKSNRAGHFGRALCALAGAVGLMAAAPAWSAPITYDFNNGTLQGWHNRVWDISANNGNGGWVDLDPNVTKLPLNINSGALQPASTDDQLFGNNGTQVDPVAGNNDGQGGQNDNHLNTLWLRSPKFALDGSGNLTVQMARGMAHGTQPANEGAVAYAADGTTGWKGVLLRKDSTGEFVLGKPRTTEGDTMVTVTFTAAELAPFVGVPCTLDLINSERGGWGWLSMDNVSIPGVLAQAKLQVAASSIGLGGSTSITVTVPDFAHAANAVTAYLTNLHPSLVTINGSAASVVPVTFAAGGTSSQTLTVAGTALGYATFGLGCAGLASDNAGLAVLGALPPSGLIGRWLTGSEDLQDKSGFSPAGTHDGAMSGGVTPSFSAEVPPGATGSSLDLMATGPAAMLISNTVSSAAGYQPTFDEGTAQQLSVVFWAKNMPGSWNPFVSKYGEGSSGWQVRRRFDASVATFTVRGTGGDDDPFNGSTLIDDYGWHHFAATWDGVAGVRKLYVDGKLNNLVPNDFGTMGLARDCYLTLGGRSSAGSDQPGNTFSGQLFDVQIYGIALSGGAVQNLFTGNTTAIAAQSDYTTIDLGKAGQVSVSIPTGANATTAVTVSVANTTPAIVSIAGAVGNVATLVFPAGGATSQTLTLTGLAEGQAQLSYTAAGLTSASLSLTVYAHHLVGRWFTGAENAADAGGFAPASTHDGTPVGTTVGTAGVLSFTTDTPPSKPGKAAKFDGTFGLQIGNSSLLDAAYAPTFDDLLAHQFSVSFWAKGVPGTWNPFVSKRGDDGIGWQMRRNGAASATNAFSLRGTAGSNSDGLGSIAMDPQWHHYAAVWDGYAGTRMCYVDGVLDPAINLTNDFGPMMMAPNHHLVLGARESYQVSATPTVEGTYNGLLYDVQMYNYPLSTTEVKNLAFIAAIKVLPAQRSLAAPQSMSVAVVLPDGANQSQAVTVQVHNDTPATLSLNGAVANVLTLTYPVGGSVTQLVTVAGITTGTGKLTATGGGFAAGVTAFNVWADPGSRMIGHWVSGAPSLAETSGFRPTGTHDGVAVGPNANSLTYSSDVPPGYSGQSLDLTAGQMAVMITNSSINEAGYVETFDNQIANKFSITFWAKGLPTGAWEPWISKRGEDNMGYQVRNNNAATPVRPTFTLRGTPGTDDPGAANGVDDQWHHYAATWDGTAGSRKLYVDGNTVVSLSGDFGPFALDTSDHLVLGGREQGGFGHWYPGLLYDVRIYSYALPAMEVGVLFTPPTQFTIALAPLVIPQNETFQMTVTLPSGTTASAPFTVYLTNNSPTVATIVGATGNVYALTFPVGSLVQAVSLLAVGPGQINITAGAPGVGSAELSTVNTVVASKLIGHWLNGAADLLDKSGFTPAGTHDGFLVFGNGVNDIPGTMAFSSDVPPGFQGQSMDLTDNTNANHKVGVVITNSAASADGGYLSTFDTDISWTFSVAFWAKGLPGTWATMVSKRGESGIGWQMRRSGGSAEAFTIRGTASGNQDGVGSVVMEGTQWHHYAAVWDGVNGTRKCYVDGVLDPSVNLTGDFGPMSLAPNHHVGIGVREQGGPGSYESWFGGKLCDVRIYNYPISAAEVTSLANLVVTPPSLTFKRWTGNQVRISWPTSFTGFALYQSSSPTTGWVQSGLSVTVEGTENVVYAPATTSSQFFRLKK